jgi:hypothetical protein
MVDIDVLQLSLITDPSLVQLARPTPEAPLRTTYLKNELFRELQLPVHARPRDADDRVVLHPVNAIKRESDCITTA